MKCFKSRNHVIEERKIELIKLMWREREQRYTCNDPIEMSHYMKRIEATNRAINRMEKLKDKK